MIRRILLAAVLALASGAALAQAPTNFSNGFNNLPSTHWMHGRSALPVPFPERWAGWYDGFTTYTSGDWVLTTVEAGGGSATEAITDADDGILLITNDSNEDDGDFFQTVGELFTFESGKEAYFEARFRINDVTQTDYVIGLQVRDTTPLAVTDGVYFQSDDADALLDLHSMASSVDTAATGVATLVDATYVTVAYYYDGATSIIAAVDNVVVATITATPPTTELTVSFGMQNGEAVADTMSVDYVWFAKER